MTCAFSIIPRIRTPTINAGDTIEIEVFFTGAGKTEEEFYKFKISYSSPYVFEKDEKGHVGYAEACISSGVEKGQVVAVAVGKNNIATFLLDEFGSNMMLPAGFFLSYEEFQNTLKTMGRNDQLKQLQGIMGLKEGQKTFLRFGECAWDAHPPLLMKLKTSPNAPSGDHNIYLTLFYLSAGEMKTDEKIVGFHINSWIESHQRKLQWTAVILGLTALLAELINVALSILNMGH